MYAISRIDHHGSRTHSWHVTIQRRNKIYTRHFSDARNGGKAGALRAAKAHRALLLRRHAPLTRREVCLIKKKTNKSGVSGLTRIDVAEWRNGRRFHRLYWDVQWPDASGKPAHRTLSIRKYGERRAFRLAAQARRQGLRQLKSAPFRPKTAVCD